MIGVPLAEQFLPKQLDVKYIMENSRMQVPFPNIVDDYFNGVDALTAQKIKQLQQDKFIAVQKEDYDEAKRLKVLIGKLMNFGERIRKLELQKLAAVQEEDYDAAKMCKVEIEKLREYNGYFEFPTSLDQSISDISILSDALTNGDEVNGRSAPSISSNKVSRDNWTQTEEAYSRVDTEFYSTQTQEGRSGVDSELDQQCSNSSVDAESPSQKQIDVTESAIQKKSVADTMYEIPTQPEVAWAETNPMAEEIFTPEPLSEAALKDLGPLLSVLDQYYVECLMSKHWQLRDKALMHLEKKIQVIDDSEGSIATFRAIHKILIRAINDKVSNVFHTSLQVLRVFIKKYSSNMMSRETHSSATEIASVLIEKLGHSNVRTKEASSEALMFLATTKEIGLSVIAPLLLKAPKSQATWKPVLGRLKLLLVGVPRFGLQPNNRSGFQMESLMSFITQSFTSPNGEVRNAAVKVTTEVYKLMGLQVEKYLKGVKPLIREVLVESFEKSSNNLQSAEKLNANENPKAKVKTARKLSEPLSMEEKRENSDYTTCSITSDQSDIQKSLHVDNGLQPVPFAVEDRINDDGAMQNSLQASEPIPVDFTEPLVDTHLINQKIDSAGGSAEITTDPSIQQSQSISIQDSCEIMSHVMQHHGDNGRRSEETLIKQSPWHNQPMSIQASCESFSHLIRESLDGLKNDIPTDSCIFCGVQDPQFIDGDELDLHFCQTCPMLVSCSNCKQIVEISTLKDHYLFECTAGKRYIECQKCLQAVPDTRMAAHLKTKECRPTKHPKITRCPLCNHAVKCSDAGWKDHLLKAPGCTKNPRNISIR